MSSTFRFDDPDFVRRYADGPPRFVPGYATLHQLVGQLIEERVDETAQVLVLGAGGGLELTALARAQPRWSFAAVDPSAPMLELARRRVGDAAERVTWITGEIEAAPRGPFDAATCLLTLHAIAHDQKLPTLRALRRRLRDGAPFVIVDNCIGDEAPDHELQLARYATFARTCGVPAEELAQICTGVRQVIRGLSPAAEEKLLAEAGFRSIELFYAGLSWRGWRGLA